mmetsp:Transcript_149340/g.479572  ORF Transcript_149340/g.479572 Transcript_149340/m.479572 type:complete len:214 (-) Transcript_149340:520-1161(-)
MDHVNGPGAESFCSEDSVFFENSPLTTDIQAVVKTNRHAICNRPMVPQRVRVPVHFGKLPVQVVECALVGVACANHLESGARNLDGQAKGLCPDRHPSALSQPEHEQLAEAGADAELGDPAARPLRGEAAEAEHKGLPAVLRALLAEQLPRHVGPVDGGRADHLPEALAAAPEGLDLADGEHVPVELLALAAGERGEVVEALFAELVVQKGAV